MKNRNLSFIFLTASILSLNLYSESGKPGLIPVITDRQIKADWLCQEKLRGNRCVTGKVTREQDAIGACDGIINGRWGFHTQLEKDPWWQIDLGRLYDLRKIIIYNRIDIPKRASHIIVLVSPDGLNFKKIYQHDGTVFYGYSDKKPLQINMEGTRTRYLRLQLPGVQYFHLDEVEIYSMEDKNNIAQGKSATQSSVSQWSKRHEKHEDSLFTSSSVSKIIERGFKLAKILEDSGVDVTVHLKALKMLSEKEKKTSRINSAKSLDNLFFKAHEEVRKLAFSNPLIDFDTILFVKRAPGTLPHMSDQFYGWWSRPGGGIYLLKGFKTTDPQLVCLTKNWPDGSFLRPDLSYDGHRIIFAYCKYYPSVSGLEKVDKEKIPADAFYNIYEMNLDGTSVKQLTKGRYDDFDARYLPSGKIVFLSTRKGQFIQCSRRNSMATTFATLPDSYVRCGGDSIRPCAVYTLHVMDPDGGNIHPISAFENFEWTPSVANDGRLLYARWDYIDRFNGPFISLWSTNPDGSNPQLVYGNFTKIPQCIFEARSIPGSNRIVFTGSSHHSTMGGSLAILDPDAGTEKSRPITRLTPEVPFPETEGPANIYYANPYPLSEQFFLVTWSNSKLPPHRGSRQVKDSNNPVNSLGIYLYDTCGNLELILRDPDISCMNPIPVRPRKKPPVYPESRRYASKSSADPGEDSSPGEGRFFLKDIYKGLEGIKRGSITRLRIIGVIPKTQPWMNRPSLGVSREDTGKFILGTVPVEKDGSAFFRVPSGVPVFFQPLDRNGFAIQTMRTLTYLQPGQTLSCIGCHEPRSKTPTTTYGRSLATMRSPSAITPGPAGSWPLEFNKLVQPVLDKFCISCHSENSNNRKAARLLLTQNHSYNNLISFGGNDLKNLAFERDKSKAGDCPARKSKLLKILKGAKGHEHVKLDGDSFSRMITWMDLYAQSQGFFSTIQKEKLLDFKRKIASILSE